MSRRTPRSVSPRPRALRPRLCASLASLLGLVLAAPAAAGPTIGWTAKLNPYQTGTNDEPRAARVLADGSVLVLAVGEEWRAVRFAPTGEQLGAASWPQRYGERAAIDPFGGVAMVRWIDKSASPTGTDDVEVMKYDGLTGRELWPAPALLDGPGDERPLNVAFDARGNVAVIAWKAGHWLLLKLDGVTGSRSWPVPADLAGASDNYTLPTALEADAEGNFVASVGFLTAKFAAATGSLLWKAPENPFGSDVLVHEHKGMRLGRDGDVHLLAQVRSTPSYYAPAIVKLSAATGIPVWPSAAIWTGSLCQNVPAALEVDGDGNVLVARYANTLEDCTGFAIDAMVQKFDGATGAPLWASPAALNGPGDSYDYPFAIAADGAGDVYLVSDSGDGRSDSGGRDVVTFKVSGATGAPLWPAPAVMSPGPGRPWDRPSGLLPDGAGDVLVVGWRMQNIGTSDSDSDVVTVKYDGATGAPAWPSPAILDGGPSRRGTVSLAAADPSGDVFVTWGAGDFTEKDWVTAKVDGRTGRLLWPTAATFNGPFGAQDVPAAIAVDAAGDLFVAGYTQYQASPVRYHLALMKYGGATGERLWAAPLVLPLHTDPVSPIRLALDPAGNPVVAYSYWNFINFNFDIRVMKCSGATGEPAWGAPFSWSSTADHWDYAMAIVTDGAGDVFVTGYTRLNGETGSWVTMKLGGALGTVSWVSQLSFTGTAERENLKPTAIALGPAGEVFVAGVGVDAAGDSPITVVKYAAATGAALWPAPYSYAQDTSMDGLDVRGMALDEAGGVFVAAKAVTLKLDGATGAAFWTTPATCLPASCAVDADGHLFVAGTVRGPLGGWHEDFLTLKHDGATGALLWNGVRYDSGERDTVAAMVLVDGDPVVAGNVETWTPFALRYTEELVLEPVRDELPAARCGVAYAQSFAGVNGLPPYALSVVSGSFPPGLSLAGDTLTGTPSGTGIWEFRVRVTDSAATPAVVERDYSLQVVSAAEILPVVASANPVCPGGTVTLSVAGSWSSYLWLPGGQTTPTVDVTVLSTTTFGVVLTDGSGCPARGSVTVLVSPGMAPPQPVITAPSQAASSASGLLASVVDHPGSTWAWSIVNGTITAGQGTSQVTFSAGSTGLLALSVVETAAGGCPSPTATASVAVVPGPTRFFTVEPCRVLDTRHADGPNGGPALGGGVSRDVPVAGRCGVPAGARSVSANVTVTEAAAAGYLAVHAAGTERPLASNLNFGAGQTRANNAILVLSAGGAGEVSLFNGASGAAHVILDVNGYFE